MCNCVNNIDVIRKSAIKYANSESKKIAIYKNFSGKYNFAEYDFAILNNYNIIETYDPNEAI